MLILISDVFGPDLPDKLARFGEVTTDHARLPEAEVLLIRSKTKCTREYIDSAPALGLIIRGGVGMDNIDIPYAESKGIQCMNTAEASTTAVAELAFALMIGLPNHLAKADRTMRDGQWLKKELKRTELSGKTLGILGLGRIGLALAARARAFQMKVLGWHPDCRFTDFAEICDSMEDVLRQSDYVSLHMPLLDDTRGLINRETLRLFKDGAYLINTARGKIVVEEDIVEAIDSGKIAGYATDVWYSDPPPDSPLFKCQGTLLTPHIGASSKENMLRISDVAEHVIELYLERSQRALMI